MFDTWLVSEENLVFEALQSGGILYLGGLVDPSLYNLIYLVIRSYIYLIGFT